MKRLFAGIELDDAVRDACAALASRLAATGFDAVYQPAENLHATLAFLGNVEDERFDSIAEALERAAPGISPFEIALDRIGAFPHERAPSVVFAGARRQGAGFRAAALGVRGAYEALGFAFDDDAVLHVTLARVKRRHSLRPVPQVEFAPVAAAVQGIALFESLFDRETHRTSYRVCRRATLGTTEL